MLTPASCVCLAAVSLMLCLNLVSGCPFGEDDPHVMESESQMDSSAPFDAAEDYSSIEAPAAGSYRGRSTSGSDMVSDGTDIVMTRDQRRRLFGETGRLRRAAVNVGLTFATTWPDGIIPFEINTTAFKDFEVGLIHRGMQTWENVTCVRFIPARDDHRHKVIITRKKGCYSALGMQMDNTQYISMGSTCFFNAAMEHELGHTLGLVHEHQRPNRDDYIVLDYNALKESGVMALWKYGHDTEDKFGLPYDYHSVMHYVKHAYAKQWNRQTIFPKMVNKTDVIGHALKPSFYDIKLVNLMYSCKNRCENPPVCREPCFVNEHCQCFCEKDAPQEVCQDTAGPDCKDMAAEGKCDTASHSMMTSCRKSCGACTVNGSVPQLPCVDTRRTCTADSCKDAKLATQCRKTCDLCRNNSRELCVDTLPDCVQRAENGECSSNVELMFAKCPRTCDFCLGKSLPNKLCLDNNTICEYYKANNGCTKFKVKMSQYCRRSCGNCDNHFIAEESCEDEYPGCLFRAWKGQCSSILNECRMSCNVCLGYDYAADPHSCKDQNERFCNAIGIRSCGTSRAVRKTCTRKCRLCHFSGAWFHLPKQTRNAP